MKLEVAGKLQGPLKKPLNGSNCSNMMGISIHTAILENIHPQFVISEEGRFVETFRMPFLDYVPQHSTAE